MFLNQVYLNAHSVKKWEVEKIPSLSYGSNTLELTNDKDPSLLKGPERREKAYILQSGEVSIYM
jgi:hypothetical protein